MSKMADIDLTLRQQRDNVNFHMKAIGSVAREMEHAPATGYGSSATVPFMQGTVARFTGTISGAMLAVAQLLDTVDVVLGEDRSEMRRLYDEHRADMRAKFTEYTEKREDAGPSPAEQLDILSGTHEGWHQRQDEAIDELLTKGYLSLDELDEDGGLIRSGDVTIAAQPAPEEPVQITEKPMPIEPAECMRPTKLLPAQHARQLSLLKDMTTSCGACGMRVSLTSIHGACIGVHGLCMRCAAKDSEQYDWRAVTEFWLGMKEDV